MKRIFDLCAAIILLILTSPLLILFCLLIWLQDFHNPFYIAERVGKDSKPFQMFKLRSMIINADANGVDSTSTNDERITKIGKIVRTYKIDELGQLFNILKGDMSFVGPRPNTVRDVALYTKAETKLLSVRPGITDISSIVFADEGEILAGSKDPDLCYNQLIRPWKSRLGLLYIKDSSFSLDLKLILLTAITLFSRPLALQGIDKTLHELNTPEETIKVCQRLEELQPHPPPGASEIVTSRGELA